jgi:hypothetical protein
MSRFRAPSPALIVAFVALVAALSGSAIALPGKNKIDRNDVKRNAITGKQLKNNSVKGADVDEGTLGKVPSAGVADSATSAGNAASLDGRGPGAFESSAVEPLHEVGTAGSSFGPGWATIEDDHVASFYKDRGRVHLQGAVSQDSGTGDLIFTLPAGYRPQAAVYLMTYGSGGTPAFVNVEPTGEVKYYAGDPSYIGLTNVSFRTGG